MSLTKFPNGLSSFGVPVLGGEGILTGGIAYFVDAANGVDTNPGTDVNKPLKSVATAYAKCRSGKGDVVYFLPSATADTWTSTLDWSKTYTHLIGCHPGWMNNRCRITSTTAGTPLLTVSGQGCIFKNVLISQEGSHATNYAVALRVTGHRCFFENVSVRNIGASAVVDNSHRSMTVGSAYDLTFRHCQFGETSYDAVTATSAVVEFDGTDAGKYIFENCMFLGAGSANAYFLKISANTGGFYLFTDCIFHNSTISTLDAMTQAFSISGTGVDAVLMKHCMISGATNLETSDSGVLFGINAQAAATGELAVALTG